MKKCLQILSFSIFFLVLMLGLCACNDEKEPQSKNISFNTLNVVGDTVYGKVSNETTEFSFLEEISSNDSTQYVVSLDAYGVHTIVTKVVPLIEGDNVFYIIETNGDIIKTYTVTIRRRPIYTVKFNTNGGTYISSQLIEEDDYAIVPHDIPILNGYTFDNWQFDFNNTIQDNITINANWSPNKYNVSYNVNGGIGEFENQSIYYGDRFIVNSHIPTRVGYDFDGWYYNGAKIDDITWKIANDVVLEAKWNAIFEVSGNTIIKFTPYAEERYVDVVIPQEIDGITITRIGVRAFEYCSRIKSVVIPKTVTHILNDAFIYCDSLTTITIPSNVVHISFAFGGCDSLKTAIFEDPNNWIGRYWEYGYTRDRVFSVEEMSNEVNAAKILTWTYYDWDLIKN